MVSVTLSMVPMRTQGANLTRTGTLFALTQVDCLSMPAFSTGTGVGSGGGTGWQSGHEGSRQATASYGAALIPASAFNPTFAKRRNDAYVGSHASKPPV